MLTPANRRPGPPVPGTPLEKLLHFALAVAIGLAGAYAFILLRLPLPWMLGPMAFCLVAAILGVPVWIPRVLQPPAIAVVGVLVGGRLSPETIGDIARWWPTLLAVPLYVTLSGGLAMACLIKFGRYDMTTAFYGGMPGGLSEMVAAADHHGGDVRTVGLLHSIRIAAIVMTLPILVQILSGAPLGPRPIPGTPITDTPLDTWFWLAVTALPAGMLAKRLGVPAAYMVGPIIASGFVHVLAISDFRPPREVSAMAQFVIGSMLGSRFAGVAFREVFATARIGIVTALIPLALTVTFVLVLRALADADPVSLLLAFSAGGVTESTLIAIALHLEVAFVAVHQLIRILMVTGGASLLFTFARRWQGGPPKPDD